MALGLAPSPAARSAASAATAPTLTELKNLTYRGLQGDSVITLVDGRWEGTPAVPGDVVRPFATYLRDFRRTGDLNGDGADEAVGLLGLNMGGTGSFVYVAAVGRKDGAPRALATHLLGDRIQVRDAAVEHGEIVLDLVANGEQDAMCCPGDLVRLGLKLQGNALVETASSARQGRLTPATAFGDTVWVLRSWSWEEAAPAEPMITLQYRDGKLGGKSACNRYFATVRAGEMPGDVVVSGLGGTMMACADSVMADETRYMRQLAGANKLGFMGGQLMVNWAGKDGQSGVMLFERKGAR